MDSRERLKTALEVGQPDRVPVIEFLIDPKVAKAADPGAADVYDFMDRVGLDAIGYRVFFKSDTTDGETFVDEWGVTSRAGPEVIRHPVKGPIHSLEDLRTYRPPDPESPDRLDELRGLVSTYGDRRMIMLLHRAAFILSAYLMGMDHLLMSFLAEPRLAEAVLDMVTEVNETIIRQAVRAGVDIVVLGDDYASNIGPMFSPEVFKKFILPRFTRIVDAIHEEGAFCIKHTDGNIYSLLDMIVDAGVDAINPIEPTAGMDIRVVKERYGKRVCIAGNIDCGELLSHGTAAEVEQAVRDCIAAASPGGGHIVTSSNSIHSSVKPENYLAMVRAVHKYGRYT